MVLNILILTLVGVLVLSAPFVFRCGLTLLIGWLVKVETYHVGQLEKIVSNFQKECAIVNKTDEVKRSLVKRFEALEKRKNQFVVFSDMITALIAVRKNLYSEQPAAPGSSQNSTPKDYLQIVVSFWEFFQFILPPKTRREAFEPAYNEIKKDYLLVQKYQSKWAKRWLCFCFLCQTSYMIGDCFRVLIGSKVKSLLLLLVPAGVRELVEIVRRYLGN